MARKKRAVINHQDIVDWCVRNPKADAHKLAEQFGIDKRTAYIHLKRIRKAIE